MKHSEPGDVASRPPPQTYEVVRGAVAGLLVGSGAGVVTALVVGSGTGSLDVTTTVSLALFGIALGGSVGLVVGVVTGVVLRVTRTASGCFAASAAASLVLLIVVVLGMTTDLRREPQGVALWAVVLAGSAAMAVPWIRRRS